MSNPVLVGSGFAISRGVAEGSSYTSPEIRALSDGRFVVVWQEHYVFESTDGWVGYRSIAGRIYQPNGTPVTPSFAINTTTENNRITPSITPLSDGGFVAAWVDYSASGGDTSGSAIRGQIITAEGARSGAEFLINTTTTGHQSAPTIAALSGDRFVVAWADGSQTGGDTSGSAIRAQMFASDGTVSGAEFLVNSRVSNDQIAPAISTLDNGSFVIVWTDGSQTGGDASGTAIRGQIFSNDGAPAGAEFLINTTTLNNQFAPVVTTLANGRFVVAWTDNSQTGGDTSGSAIRGQVFEADGTPFGDEFLANTRSRNDQYEPTITALPDGRFVIAWTDGSRLAGC